MSHVRAQIAAALSATLTGLGTTGARVHVARPEDLAIANTALPALLVYADSESVTPSPTVLAWPNRLERVIEVRIIALADDDGRLEDTLAQILTEIEAALHGSSAVAQLGGLLPAGLHLASVEIERDADGERTTGRLNTTWAGIYYTYSNAPETAAT